MEKFISKEIESDLTKLGIYQIVGGAVGLLFVLWSFIETPVWSELNIFIHLFVVLFFSYSLFCGLLCLKTRRSALGHSLANQVLQIVGFAVMGFAFKYVAGVYLTIGLDLTESVNFGFGAGVSKFDFNFNNENDRIEVDINLVAFALIFWIDKLMRKVNEEAV